MLKSGIYIISSQLFPDRKYIGSAKNLRARKKRHFRELATETHFNQKLQNHAHKYGIQDLQFQILLFCPKHALLFWEQRFINYYQPYFNICPTAGSRQGAKHSARTRTQIAQKIRQKPNPQPNQILSRYIQKTTAKTKTT
jgi:group I intron endonuclease